MTKLIRNAGLLSLALLATGSMSFAQHAGEATYKAKCAMCHGATGAGDTPAGKAMKVPSLGAADVVKKTDAELIAATANGKGKMPAYKGKLTDAQIKDAVAYIRVLQKK